MPLRMIIQWGCSMWFGVSYITALGTWTLTTQWMDACSDDIPLASACLIYMDTFQLGVPKDGDRILGEPAQQARPELCEVDEFMWALQAQYEDALESERARNYLHALKQGWKTVCEYTEDFKRHTKVQGWPDGVQYRLGLHPEIRETILRSLHPVTLNAWMREAADAES
ncbi:UNVERIFIED_CONTAM: hypothetical protein K2H54_045378 [Gekko kuhli]